MRDHVIRSLVIYSMAAAMDDEGAPGTARERHRIAVRLVDALAHHRDFRDVMTAYSDSVGRIFNTLLVTVVAHREMGPRLRGIIATAHARQQHRREGTPHFVTGVYSPSGCAVCGRDRHHHTATGNSLLFRAHRFEPVTSMSTIKARMRQRRYERAAWLAAHGTDPCRDCGMLKRHHGPEHEVYTGTDLVPFGAPPEDFERGPWVLAGQEDIIGRAVHDRSMRWHHLYPETWDGPFDDEMRAAAAAEATVGDLLGDYDEEL